MKEQGIEEIFKKAFDHFESDVDPNVWTNVQQAINAPAAAPANHGTGGSVAGKAGAVAGKLGVKGIIAIIAAVTGVSVGTYFLLPGTESKKVVPSTVQSQPQTEPAAQQPSPVTNEPGTASQAVTPRVDKVVTEPKVKEKKPSPVRAEAQPVSSTAASAPKNNTPANTPATAQPTPVKTPPALSSPSPDAAKTDEPKPRENAPPDNHSYQNNFADINDYLETESPSQKKGLMNVFSPNGDGKNDVLTLKTKNLKSLTVTVFDQSGKLIYQWKTLDGGWDGNLPDGRPAPIGNYYYSLLAETVDGKICMNHSTLVLKR